MVHESGSWSGSSSVDSGQVGAFLIFLRTTALMSERCPPLHLPPPPSSLSHISPQNVCGSSIYLAHSQHAPTPAVEVLRSN